MMAAGDVGDDFINMITQAAAKADPDTLRNLLEGTPPGAVNRTNTYGRTALQVMNGMCATTAEILLNHGADVNVHDPHVGRTPLHDIAESGIQATLELLLLNGADPVARDNWGNTPAHLAAENGGPTRVQVLQTLSRVSTLTERNHAGDTPLDIATRKGHQEIIRWLDTFLNEERD